MDLSQLRYFTLVAQHGSLSAAARVLRISQPTLTLAIRRLEQSCGTTLLHRGRNGISLTRTGQELLGFAKDIFVQLERVEEHIRGLEQEEIGRFVIGCHESLGGYFLPQFLSSFLKAAPRIEIVLWNGTSQQVWEAVMAREVHLGLVVNPVRHPELVITELFADATDTFVAARHAPAAGKPKDRMVEAVARLEAGPIVYAGRQTQCRELIEKLSAVARLSPRVITCGGLELVKSIAIAGLGVALLPRRVAAYGQPNALRRLHPSLPSIPDRICLVYRADSHRTRALVRVKDAIIDHGHKLRTAGSA